MNVWKLLIRFTHIFFLKRYQYKLEEDDLWHVIFKYLHSKLKWSVFYWQFFVLVVSTFHYSIDWWVHSSVSNFFGSFVSVMVRIISSKMFHRSFCKDLKLFFVALIAGRSTLSNPWKLGTLGHDGEGVGPTTSSHGQQSRVRIHLLSSFSIPWQFMCMSFLILL